MEEQQKVIQLVGVRQEDKSLYLTEEGKKFLENIDGPISVISIAGLYRTGKSFLVNELLDKIYKDQKSQRPKFKVGSTVQSCTKGLNVWGMPFASTQSNKKFHYIIVDSEGIGSMQQQLTYDINLMMLIFLISSTVIYNSIGAIDQQSLDQLRVIVKLKKSLNGQQSFQPRLVWVLRDFALQLVNKKGQTLTSNQYLEECLQIIASSNKQIIKKNQIRQAIKSCLPNRQCITFVRPTIKQEELSILDTLPKNKIRHQFNEQIQKLFITVFRHQSDDIKCLNSQDNHVDGSTLVKMIQFYVSQINCNKVPEIKSVWELIQSTKIVEIYEQCETFLKRQVMKITLPSEEQSLRKRLNQIQQNVFQSFEHHLPSSDIKMYKQFNLWFSNLKDRIRQKLLNANKQAKSKKVLKSIRDKINKQIQFDKIDPCQLTQIRQVIQGLNLRKACDEQTYEYVLSTLLDVMEIAQEKSIKMRNDLTLIQARKKENELENNYKEEEMIRLKQNYHDALKEISTLKASQVTNLQELAVLKQQFLSLEQKCRLLTEEKLQKEEELRVKIQELNQKIKRKSEQTNESMKFLRSQNQSLLLQIQQTKKELAQRHTQMRKQLIFEDKIKQSWDRFEQERTYFKKQLTKFKQLYFQSEEKNRILTQKQQKLQNILRRQRDLFAKKQRQFCQQLKWMKQNYSKTKQAYSQFLNTRLENEKILQDVTVKKKNNLPISNNSQIAMANSKASLIAADKAIIEELSSNIQNLKREKQSLIEQNANFKKQLQSQKTSQSNFEKIQISYQQKISSLENHIEQLQQHIHTEKQRFYSCLKQLQESKQQERIMYQESILRLINNIQGQKIKNIDSTRFTIQNQKVTKNPHSKIKQKSYFH